jgi:hypothetical protein
MFMNCRQNARVSCNIKIANKIFRKPVNFKYVGRTVMGEKRGAYRILLGRPEGRGYLGNPGVEGRIILKWISKK